MRRTISDADGLRSVTMMDSGLSPTGRESVCHHLSGEHPEFETVTIYPGRSGERVGVCRADDGTLLAVLIEQADGTWRRLQRPPTWLKPGLFHKRCAKLQAEGKPVCSRCAATAKPLSTERRRRAK